MVDAAYFLFTHEEAVRDGKDPWRLQSDFDAEVNLDDMAATGNAFVRAAEQAREAEDLAVRATQLSQQPGALNGHAIVDGTGRLVETNNALPRTEAEEAVDWIFKAMNSAHRAEMEALRLIEAPELNFRHELNQANAQREWSEWHNALVEAVNAYNALLPENRPGELAVRHPGGEMEYAMLSGTTWDLPEDRAARIRAHHLGIAAIDAAGTHDRITGEITAYRHELAGIADELGRRGYDAPAGPLEVFATPQMARFSAEQLKEELAKDNPAPHIVEMHTRQLGLIEDAVNADANDSRVLADAQGNLTAEGRYVRSFLDGIGADALGALGRLDSGPGYRTARQDVADIIHTWMDPEAGGIDPATGPVPESIRHFVYGYQETALYDRAERPFIEELDRFNGFGALMAQATVAPGDAFAKDMAHAALDVERKVAEAAEWTPGAGMWAEWIGSDSQSVSMPNTGSSGLLQAAALNTAASADLLNDQPFRDGLLAQGWDDSLGAAKLVESGTTIPPGTDHNDPAARAYTQAAYHVLADAPEHRASLLRNVDFQADNVALQQAVSDTALTWMPMLTDLAEDESAFREPQPGGSAFSAPDLLGADYVYSFDLNHDDRMALFSLINASDPEVRQNFSNGLSAWQSATAEDAFRMHQESGGQSQIGSFDAIGRAEGMWQRTEVDAQTAGMNSARNQASLLAGINSTGALVKDMVPILPGKAAVIAGTYAVGEAVRHALPTPLDPAELQADVIREENRGLRRLVMDAAVQSDFNGLGGTRLLNPATDPTIQLGDALRVGSEEVEAQYRDYVNAMNDRHREQLS
jgi:hypothetical protein